MNNNFNDIIDVILTLIEDDNIADNIAISGSIVPYIITGKESFEYHSDFYILVKEKNIGMIRDKISKISKEYAFDIISDSKKYSKDDYGFKAKYEHTMVGFFPYSIINNNLTIKTYSLNKDNMEIKLKTKLIKDVTKNSIIKKINFAGNKALRIMSPEFVLVDKETREKQPGNPTKETMELLNNICDESVLKVIRESVSNTKVKIETKKIKANNNLLIGILIAAVILLVIIAYICIKK